MKGVDSLALIEENEEFALKATRHFKQLRKGERKHGIN